MAKDLTARKEQIYNSNKIFEESQKAKEETAQNQAAGFDKSEGMLISSIVSPGLPSSPNRRMQPLTQHVGGPNEIENTLATTKTNKPLLRLHGRKHGCYPA
jgi:hypothetical protein